jgi:hypothetical protein
MNGYRVKNLHFFSHWTFREELQALRCEKRCRFFGGVSGDGADWGWYRPGRVQIGVVVILVVFKISSIHVGLFSSKDI